MVAEQLNADSGTVFKATNITLSQNNLNRLTAKNAEISIFARDMNLSGGVTADIDKEVNLVAEQIRYYWEKSKLETTGKAVMQHSSSGSIVTAGKTSVNWLEDKVDFFDGVCLTSKHGSVSFGEKAVYYSSSKLLVITGSVKSDIMDIKDRCDKLTVNLSTGEAEASLSEKLIYRGKLW